MDTPQWFVELQQEWSEVDEDTDFAYGWIAALANAAIKDDTRLGPLLARLERQMVVGTEWDGNIIATGFMEALLGAWDRGFDLEPVWHLVGPESSAYCVAWNDFNGIPSPDWMRRQDC